jgi:predicted pyridoxine 5'-phosphate oxidase superfamily flavin-nucleotide-binding protein
VIEPAPAHFLAQRYTLYVGSLDADGRPWASQLVGPPGFVTAATPTTVRIDAAPAPGDPLLANVRADPAIGLLAIDLVTRRRFRVNGTVRSVVDGVIELDVTQAYGNCPKYIQRREPVGVSETPPDAGRVVRTRTLSDAQRARIAAADTFFLATAHPSAGADVSHRGGRPGFLEAPDRQTLSWPDYPGNMMFMSLGNIAVHPRAGVLVVDFERGDVLSLTGTATVDWDPARARRFAGAGRVIDLHVEDVVDTPEASTLRWRLLEPSPANP